MALSILILGGTTESRLLAEQLADDARYETLLSFAGRTEGLLRPSTAHRVGGFGGSVGLSALLRERPFDALVDATHPFAARISDNAVEAAARAGTPLIRLMRPAWLPQRGDRWVDVPDMAAAAHALGSASRRVFLTIGRQEVRAFSTAPQHDYLIRAIDPFELDLPNARVILARGPFALEDERALLERERIDIVVSKNAGTSATYAKIEAARALSLPVIVVARPRLLPAHEVNTLGEVRAWLESLLAR